MSISGSGESGMAKIEKYRFLYEVSRGMAELRDVDSVLQVLVKCTQSYFQSDAVSVIWLEDDGTQVFRAVESQDAEKILGLKLPKSEGISGWVAEHGGVLRIPDVSQDNRFFAAVDENTGFNTLSILAAPVFRETQTTAVLEVINPSLQIDGEEAKSLLQALSTLTGAELERCELFAQALRYQKVFEAWVDPCLLLNQQGTLQGANHAARLVFGLGEDQHPQYRFDDLRVSAYSFKELLNQMHNSDRFSWDFIQDGESQRTFRATILPVQFGDAALYQWSAYDITDFISLEDARLQLFNMLVHDLRVPLGSIHHSIELVMTAWQENDVTIPVDQVLEIASRSEHRMERLISDILDTTRLNSQTKILEVTPIDIAGLVQEALNIVQSSAQRRNHLLNTHIHTSVGTLQGDLDLLQRVLINILGNAVKYTPDGGAIDINVYDDAQNVLFAVSDSGPGILPADKDHIFELFFRGNTSRVKGAGIGLAFSKLAIEAHGGSIWLDDEVVSGAKFVFNIPKQLPDSAIVFEE